MASSVLSQEGFPACGSSIQRSAMSRVSIFNRLIIVAIITIFTACSWSPHPRDRESFTAKEQYSENEQGTLKCSPRILYRGQMLVLTMPVPHPSGLAIKDPDGNWFYLQDKTSSQTLIPHEQFAIARQLDLHSATTTGLRYVDGRPEKHPIFTKTGAYLTYFAENLETEPENTWFIEATVYFHNRDK